MARVMPVSAAAAAFAGTLLAFVAGPAIDWIDDRAAGAGPQPLRLAVIGDQTGTDDLDAAHAMLGRAVDRINAEGGVDLVLHVGDLIESALPVEDMRADFDRARAHLDRLDAPWMLTPGDHDVNPPDWETGSTDRSREALFKAWLSEADPGAADGFMRTRRVDGWAVIGLYSHDTLHADPRWGVTYMAAPSPAQLDALARELDAARDADGIVAFIHQPLWYNEIGWAPAHRLLADAGATLVIAGHTHYPQIEPARDGVTYMTVGAAGGSTKRGSPSAGALHHVTIVELGGGDPMITLLPLDGGAPRPPEPRSAMDRVQAVDVMLGSLAVRPDLAPRLTADCDAPDGARLSIPDLGSPIDKPLTLTVSADRLAAPRFRDGACVESSQSACTVAPGYGVQSSNNSSVVMARRHTEPFFTADAPNAARTGFELTVTAAFDLDGADYRLEETVPLAAPCP
ncbi:MAG: metallophosphoesterase family protein [Oceanicaulis sp.]